MRHADSEKLLGYEIRRNGKAIGFTTSDTYTDDLGAANNLTYRSVSYTHLTLPTT